MKGNKGITLIALVITIIVLLILAGVSIAMLTGENSILKKGSQADAENQLGAANDAISILVAEKVSEYYEKAYVDQEQTTLQNGLNAYIAGAVDADACERVIQNDNIKKSGDGSSITVDWTNVDKTATGTNRDTEVQDVFKITLTDNTTTYTSHGAYRNGKVTWKITK